MRQLTAELLGLKEELNHSFCRNHWNSVQREVSLPLHLVGNLKNGECRLLGFRRAASRRDPGFNFWLLHRNFYWFNKHASFYKFIPELKKESKSSQSLLDSFHSCMHVRNITINCYCLLNPKINRTTITIAFNVSGEPRIDSLLWRERFEICWPWYRREQDGNYWTGEWVFYSFVILTVSVKTV